MRGDRRDRQGPRGQQQTRIDEIVGIDHPLQRRNAGVEVGADVREREIDDRCIDLRDQHASEVVKRPPSYSG